MCVCGGGGSSHSDTAKLEVIAIVQFLWNLRRSAPKIRLCASHPMLASSLRMIKFINPKK